MPSLLAPSPTFTSRGGLPSCAPAASQRSNGQRQNRPKACWAAQATSAIVSTTAVALQAYGGRRTSRAAAGSGRHTRRICRAAPDGEESPAGHELGGIIDGKAIAAAIRAELAAEARGLAAEAGVVPGLAVVLVGDRPDSAAYVRNKTKAAKEVGCKVFDHAFPDDVSEEELLQCIITLNKDEAVHGILVQLPLPRGLDERRVLEAIDVRKDVDGLSIHNLGSLARPGAEPSTVPCTPAGCMELLHRSGVSVAGKECVVLGRSGIVGMPMALLLIQADATVRVCHSGTDDVARACGEADVVVAAVGRPGFVRGEWLKPGCIVIDVGINRVADASRKSGYRLVGDVDFESARRRAALITPVPGGVGPMTVAMLLRNTVQLAAKAAREKREL